MRVRGTVVSKKAVVQNKKGIHVRPSGVIMDAIEEYQGTVRLRSADAEVVVESPVSIIMLGLSKGDKVEIQVEGPDEEEMCGRLVELFERHFDFPPR